MFLLSVTLLLLLLCLDHRSTLATPCHRGSPLITQGPEAEGGTSALHIVRHPASLLLVFGHHRNQANLEQDFEDHHSQVTAEEVFEDHRS